MPLERVHHVEVFVYIVESPSHSDFYERQSEGALIAQAVALNQIPCSLRTVTSLGKLEEALMVGIYEEMLKQSGRVPIVHVSAHGNKDGIELTDGSFVSWSQLRGWLKSANQAFKGNLLLCMSTCEGFGASRMAMVPGDTAFPYFMFVGCNSQPTWAETAVAYATFYHHVACGRSVPQAVAAMREASGNQAFLCGEPKDLYEGFLQFLKDAEKESRQAESILAEKIEEGQPGIVANLQKRHAEGA